MKVPMFLFVLLGALLLSYPLNAQQSDWINYTGGDRVYEIVDGGNWLWIGTDAGLLKFNKATEELTFYNHANANLPSNNIWSVGRDMAGNVWVGSKTDGVGKFDGTSCQVFNPTNSSLPAYGWNSGISIDNTGRTWVGCGRYLSVYDGLTWKSYATGSSLDAYIEINDIAFDKKGNGWIGASWGLGKLVGDSLIQRYGGIKKQVFSVALDKNDMLWVGTVGSGLMKFDGQQWTVFDTTNSGIPGNVVSDIKFDIRGDLWLGTEHGLGMFDGTTWKTFNKDNSPMQGNAVTSLESDAQGTIWIGVVPIGLYSFDGSTWKSYPLNQTSLQFFRVSSLAFESNGDRWITSWGEPSQLVMFDGKKWQSYDPTQFEFLDAHFNRVFSDSSRKIWTGRDVLISYSNSNGWRAYNTNNQHRGDAIKVDRRGNIWQASNQGLQKFDGKQWTIYDTDNSSIPANIIDRIAVDARDDIWFSTTPPDYTGRGRLVKFDGSIWSTMFTCENDFDWISGIEFDTSGNVWIGIMNYWMVGVDYGGGLRKYDGNQWTSYNIRNSGLPSNSVVDLCLDKNDNLWIATYAGAVAEFDGKNAWKAYTVRNSGLPGHNAEIIRIDAMNNKWIGVQDGGLAVFREGGVVLTDVSGSSPTDLPEDISLSQNYPNPFNPATLIRFSTPSDGFVTLKIYDILGREVAILVDGFKEAGVYEVRLNASSLSSGVYAYRLESGGQYVIRKMLLLR